MLARQPKRARSPTPPPSHAYGAFGESSSPLDNVFLKRQRQAAAHPLGGDLAETSYFNDQDSGRPWSPHGWSTSMEGQPEAGPSYSRPGRERRRAKQWELLNGPALARQHPTPFAHHSNHYTSRDVASLHCQQDQLQSVDSRPSVASSGSIAFPSEQLGEIPSRPLMSSSPVRHTAPTSSPFRDCGPSSQIIEDDWDADELGKAWGEEYGSQNLLLRSLHRARLVTHTPESTHLQTPAPSQRPDPFRVFDIPSGPSYPSSETPPHARPGLPRSTSSASSNFFPTPYRHGSAAAYFPSSSPYIPNPYSVETPSRSSYETDMMDVGESDHQAGELDDSALPTDVGRRYEEANRLLAELEVARRQRTI